MSKTPKTPQIHSTTKYDRFKLFASNRNIKKPHLKSLIEAIKIKNLLYLFPIIVNKSNEIIDGQHRLSAAQTLGVPIYFIVDDDVSQADIAMVNNNRKGWTAMDYINFYYKEGVKEYKNLKYLLDKYPLTIVGAAKLMEAGATSNYFGGGRTSLKIKVGKISDDNFEVAKIVCEIIKESISGKVRYAFRPDIVLELKSVLIKNNVSKTECIKKLSKAASSFPIESNPYDIIPCRIIKDTLSADKIGHSADEVYKILQDQMTKGK